MCINFHVFGVCQNFALLQFKIRESNRPLSSRIPKMMISSRLLFGDSEHKHATRLLPHSFNYASSLRPTRLLDLKVTLRIVDLHSIGSRAFGVETWGSVSCQSSWFVLRFYVPGVSL